ncbi:MAG: nitronate monooxygenase [Clostridiales bacterium]|nr:nitronate monooxygenase [Clostridiales bacterium]
MTQIKKSFVDFLPFHIGNLVAKLPIIQGGMGVGISLSGLASAVAKEGGIGVISAACIGRTPRYESRKISDEQALAEDIQRARKLSAGVIGVNIMVALTNFESLCRTASQQGADIIFAGAGLPLALPSFIDKDSKTKLVPIVSSGKAATMIARWWKEKYHRLPDAFVAEGPMAGGHLGFKSSQIHDPDYTLDKILPDVCAVAGELSQSGDVHIPVIAAGGIFSGDDINRYLELGAEAVQMGTRFVATTECDAPDSFKQSYVDSKQEDILIVQSPVGMPGRALKNSFIKKMEQGETSPVSCRYHCITSCKRSKSAYCIADALLRSLSGNAQEGLIFVGTNAWRIQKVQSVRELIKELKDEYLQARRSNTPVFESLESI